METIPAGVYKNQANEGPVKSVGGWVGIGSNMDMDATLVYNMTKAFWDNIAEIHRTAEWMKVITLKTALNEMNIPLHAGAYRYYKEVGVKIPDALIPPEAK
ncbi:MAG TPA: hypothetical protein EYQ81_07130 [Sneathiellales bacterium]|nr:hypothetical protein [Sneathiellales bacterium]